MSYLVQQLWGTLLLAFFIGAVFGWLLKSWLAVRLQLALKDAGARQDALHSELGRVREELKELRERQRRTEAESSSAQQDTPVAPAAGAATAELSLLEAQLKSSQERVAELQASHLEASALLAVRLGEVADLRVQLEQLRKTFNEASDQSASERPSAVHDEPTAQATIEALRSELARTQEELQSLRERLPSAAPLIAMLAPSERPRAGADDLQRIRGVGPRIARKLQALGIHSYRQIASADAAQLRRIADALPSFASRIQREDWQGQCLRLHQEKYGNPPA